MHKLINRYEHTYVRKSTFDISLHILVLGLFQIPNCAFQNYIIKRDSKVSGTIWNSSDHQILLDLEKTFFVLLH